MPPPQQSDVQHLLVCMASSPFDMCFAYVAGRNGAGQQKAAAPSSRELFLQQNPELLQKFGSDLLPLLLQVYNNTALPQVGCAS